jgi:hypothetical protein
MADFFGVPDLYDIAATVPYSPWQWTLLVGWLCKGCGASWAPSVPGCMRCNGRGNRASNPLVDIVISPPDPARE